MSLLVIDFDFLIVLFWILVFFVGPILKAAKKKKNFKSESKRVYDTTQEYTSQDEYSDETHSTHSPRTIEHTEDRTLRSLLNEIEQVINADNQESVPDVEANHTKPVAPPPIKKSRKKSRVSEKLEVLQASNLSNNLSKDAPKVDYHIKSNEDLRRAFVWSEVLNRKYN